MSSRVRTPLRPSQGATGISILRITPQERQDKRREASPFKTPVFSGSKVPVRDLLGQPLTPCSWEKALQNLRDGLATWDSDGVLHLNYQPLAYRRIYRQVQRRDGYVCAWCGGPASTLDHVIPICWGGETSLDNCVIACRACNHSRNNALPSTFVRWTGYRPQHPVIRRILAREQECLIKAQERLKTRPLSSCLTREEAQIWIAYHAPNAERVMPPPVQEPVTRVKPDIAPFSEYFVP